MKYVPETSEKSKIIVAAQLDAAAMACDASPLHSHDGPGLIDKSPADLVNDPATPCPHCRYFQLWRRYSQLLNNETEERAESLTAWACTDVAPDVVASVLEQCKQQIAAAQDAAFDVDLAVTAVSPRQRLEVGAWFERAKRELGIVEFYAVNKGKVLRHVKTHSRQGARRQVWH